MIEFGGRSVNELSTGYDCQVNPTTGAATLRVPVPLPPGRNGFGPAFSLTYTSGSGNSPFGAGWALMGLPMIGIDTREHVARWDGTDGYQLSGDELVPWLALAGSEWKPRGFVAGDWSVAFLRSRLGGPQVRVEKWVHRTSSRVHFRTRDARNTVTIFGARTDGRSRIADPNDATRTLVWLPEVQLDSAGNAIWFEYEPETLDGVDTSAPFERRRISLAQRYLKRLRYGNAQPVALTDQVIAGTLPQGVRWCFQGVFDYGDHSAADNPQALPDRPWLARLDPFTTCHPGFEIRTYRLCRRVLSFHDFDELGPGPTLTGAFVLTHEEDVAGSMVREIAFVGHRRDNGVHTSRTLPPLKMTYAGPFVAPAFVPAPAETHRHAPAGLAANRYAFVDLLGDGLPGIVEESERAWFYKPNEGNGRFGEQSVIPQRPQTRRGAWAFGDVNRDGNTDLSQLSGRMAGLFSHDRDANRWTGFRPFEELPHVEGVRRAQWVDLNGDGRPDIVIPKGGTLSWFASDGEGFAPPTEVTVPEFSFPTLAEDPMLDLFFADMNGDGLVDLVRVQNGRVEYWPSLGNGRFGEPVLLADSPRFAPDNEFDAGRLRFVDLDGSGTTDLIYLGRGEVTVWRNASGNRITPGPRLRGLPFFDSVSTIAVLDFLGDGRQCLVWSTPLPGRESALHYLPLTAVERPRMLLSVDDSLGQVTWFTYSSSATHYLRDQRAGTPWNTRLPQHVSVVDQREVRDAISNTVSLQRFEYRDGFYDGVERQFRGFGRVDVYDLPAGPVGPEPGVAVTAPSLVRTWIHVGPTTRRLPLDAYAADPDLPLLPPHVIEEPSLTAEEIDDATRSLAGRILRSETWAINEAGSLAAHPFQVTQTSYRIIRGQPASKRTRAAFQVLPEESLDALYEQAASDPRLSHSVTVAVSPFGIPVVTADVAYARRAGRPRDVQAQNETTVLVQQQEIVDFDLDQRFELGIPIEGRDFELTGLLMTAGRITPADLRATTVTDALAAPRPHHETAAPPAVGARLLSWDQSFYWNDNRTAALPFGELGNNVLVHHEESACFTPGFIASVYEGRVDAAMLTNAGYIERDGLLWQPGETHFFAGATKFFQREALEQIGGSRTSFEYDAYALELTANVDALGNRVEAVIDYHTLDPWRITDPNGNISEVRYDPLGVVVTSTAHGHVQAQPWGFDALQAIESRTPSSAEELLAGVAHYLQGASQFLYYDLDAWRRDASPTITIRLTREELRNDGLGNVTPDGRVQIAVSYFDGLGRVIQAKTMVEAGPAIDRDEGGAVILEGGVPLLAESAERWQVSGHIVYDAKQKPRKQYEPYFSPTWHYESDSVLRQFGAATLVEYDALGRETARFFPNGTHTRTRYGAWETEHADANDTVMESAYRTAREGLPNDDPERQAFAHSQQHAGTSTTTYFDPTGHEAALLERGGATAGDRRSESHSDAQGNVVEMIDPRGLTAFSYVRDMQGRALLAQSIDGGDTRTFYHAENRQLLTWDSRGYEIEHGYDALDRPTTLHVRGNGLDHRVEERTYGGNDAAAIANNLNGALVRVRDQAGESVITRYDPMGQALSASRRIRTDTGEPDWRAAVPLEAAEFVTETLYDALGRARRTVMPDGSTRTITYVRSGGVASETVTTDDGKVVDVAVVDGATYNARGQRSRLRLGNGVAVEYLYDPNTFRLTQQTASNAVRTFQDARYTYDATGNIVRIVDNALTGANAIVTGSVLPPRRDYVYDAHYRLKRATGRVHQALLEHDYIPALGGPLKGTRHITLNNGAALEAFTRQYDYDAANNLQRVRHIGVSQSWTTDMWISATSNRSIPALDEGGVAIPNPETRFDAAGNLAALSHLRAINWSWRSTLSRAVIIERSGDVDDDEVYTYGADGMRVRKVTTRKIAPNAVEIIEKVYLGECERKRIIRNGVLILERWTSHFRSDDERIALLHRWTVDTNGREMDNTGPARFRYQLNTHQGSSAIELDENAGVVSYEEYFPYGGSSFIAGDEVRDVTVKEYRYSGKERDDATNLYYFGHRYYATWTCRWLSPDPLGPKDDLNLYQFVLGDPVGNVDPDGLQTNGQTRGNFEIVETAGLPTWAVPIWQRLTPDQQRDVANPAGRMTIIVFEGVAQYVSRAEAVRRLEAIRRSGVNVTRYDIVEPPPPPPEIPPDAPVEVITFEDDTLVVAGPLPDQEVTLSTGLGEESGGSGSGSSRRARTTGGAPSSGSRRSSGSSGGRRSSGTGSGGRNGGTGTGGRGTGTGLRGQGTGGGGSSETVPSQPAAADGAGEGTTGGPGLGATGSGSRATPSAAPAPPAPPGPPAAPGAPDGPSQGGPPQAGDPDAQSRTGSQNGSRDGSRDGSRNGSPGGQGRRPGSNGTGRSTSGGATGASGTGTNTGGGTAPALDPTSTSGQPGPPGLQANGVDVNGAVDGDPNASRNATGNGRTSGGVPNGSQQGSPTGSAQGSAGASPGGREGGTSTTGSPNAAQGPPESALDTLTRWAGYANFEFSEGGPNGQRGGIPGGSGRLNLGWAGQVLYIGLTVVSWIGPGALFKGLRLGGRLALRGLVWAARGIGGALRVGGRAVLNAMKQALTTRTGIHALIDFAKRGSTTRVFERAPFGSFRLRDLSIGLGDWRVKVNTIWVDPALPRLQRAATFLHEGVHWMSNQFLPNIARFKQFTGQSGLRGFIGSNVKFYEESVAYTLGGLVGSMGRSGWKMGRPFEIIGFIPAWTRSLKGSSTAHMHVIMGLPFVAAAVGGATYTYRQLFGGESGK